MHQADDFLYRIGRVVAQWKLAWLAFISLGGAFSASGCAQVAVATPEPVGITIAGSTAMRPVLQDLTQEFSRRHPNVVFDIRSGGSTLGEDRVASGQVDLAASTLLERDVEFTSTEPATTRIPLGVDGVAVIVHAGNDIPNLTLSQLLELYNGDVLAWDEVGGLEMPILLVSREDGSGSRIAFESRVMGDNAVSLTAVMMPTSRDVVEFVGGQPHAIGYVSRAFVQENLTADAVGGEAGEAGGPWAPVRVVPVNGTLPTDENLSDRSYPLIQPLFLVSQDEPQGWVREFVNFALSPAGQEIVGHYHLPVR